MRVPEPLACKNFGRGSDVTTNKRWASQTTRSPHLIPSLLRISEGSPTIRSSSGAMRSSGPKSAPMCARAKEPSKPCANHAQPQQQPPRRDTHCPPLLNCRSLQSSYHVRQPAGLRVHHRYPPARRWARRCLSVPQKIVRRLWNVYVISVLIQCSAATSGSPPRSPLTHAAYAKQNLAATTATEKRRRRGAIRRARP